MTVAATAHAPSRSNATAAILLGGLLAGIGDITQAFVVFGHYYPTATPFRILQGIPRGLLGTRVTQMGWNSALLGLFIHFLIATTAAAVFYAASRKMRFMLDRWIICGLLFGECVFLFMYFVVMPLSLVGWPKFNTATYITGPIGHPLLVGLPIAWAVRRFSR
jgi:hypothetical protein